MDKLEKIWENTSSALQGMLSGIERGITGIFGSSNARQIKRYQSKISQINALDRAERYDSGAAKAAGQWRDTG
jgi:preprotein translocase subunit SecA